MRKNTADSRKLRAARFRHQFETSAEERNKLDNIKQRTGLSSYADIIRVSIRMLDWITRKKEEGFAIALVKEGETRDVEVLW